MDTLTTFDLRKRSTWIQREKCAVREVRRYFTLSTFLCAAQRFRCASAIRLRASALNVRFGPDFFGAVAPPLLLVPVRFPALPPARRARACWSREIS